MNPTPILLTNIDGFWLNLAKKIACFSNDPFTKVGCVLVDQDNQMVGAGFNHLPKGCEPTNLNREDKNRVAIHAEDHALSSHSATSAVTAYLWPVEPCHECAQKLSKAGVLRVIAPIDFNSDVFKRWHINLMKSRKHLDRNCIERVYPSISSTFQVMSVVDGSELKTLSKRAEQLWQK